MKALLTLIAACSLLRSPGPLRCGLCIVGEQPTPLHNLLTRSASEFPGKAGIWVKHLTTGETAGVRDGEIFNSASVIKIPVLVLAFQMAERGELKLDERITIRKEDIRGGSGIFRYHDEGLQPTFRDVLLQMIITSDNTATDLSIAKVGGVARVNAWLKQAGYADGHKLHADHRRAVREIQRARAGRRPQREDQRRSQRTGSARSRPRSVGLMLEAIEKKTIASAASCEAMLRMLRAQQAGAAAPQSLSVRAGRAQDRRLPAGARQRRRHHLRAQRADRRVVPRQRDHRQLRRGRRSHRPLRAATRGVFR